MSLGNGHSAPRVVAVGGGHGLAATIRAVRQYAGHATAVVATADDGGSTGRLRDTMALPAPGDLRRCLVAMAGAEDEPLGQALEYRFGGTDVEGHALGNLMLAGLAAVTGDFVAATGEMARLLGVDSGRGRVLPATAEPVVLRGTTASGHTVSGQVAVSGTAGLRRVQLDPAEVKAPDGVVAAVLDADQVVLGPGSLFTSVLAAVVVDDLRDALVSTGAQRVYVCNLRAEAAETRGYDVAGHVRALREHGVLADLVLVQADGALELGDPGIPVVAAELARPHRLAHDSDRLAAALAGLLSRS